MATRREKELAVEALDDKIARLETYLKSLIRRRNELNKELHGHGTTREAIRRLRRN